MSESVRLSSSTVPVPAGFHDLVKRRIALMQAKPKMAEFPAYAQQWSELSDAFAQIGYMNNAQLCLEHAEQYGWRPPEA